MKRILHPRLRLIWIFFTIIILLPVVIFSFRARQEMRTEAEDGARESVLRVARLAADRHQRMVESTQQVLFLLVRLQALRGGEIDTCRTLFADLILQHPRYANLGMANLDGTVAASGVTFQQPLNVSTHAWFRRIVQNPDVEAGDYQVDVISGKPVAILSHPVLEPAGRLKFVAFAALDLGWVNQIESASRLPVGSAVTVSDMHGKILARNLEPEKWIASGSPEADLLKNSAAEGELTAESVGVDGVRRLYASVLLDGSQRKTGARVSVGIPVAAIYAGTDRGPGWSLLMLVLASVLAVAALWILGEVFIVRGIHAVAASVQRLQKGDFDVRAGDRMEALEFHAVEGNLEAMAGATQARVDEERRLIAGAQDSETRMRIQLDKQNAREQQVRRDLESANRTVIDSRQSEDAAQREILRLKDNLQASIREIAVHVKNEELLARKEAELRRGMEVTAADADRLKGSLEAANEELKKTVLYLDSAWAEAEARREEGQSLEQKVKLVEADLEEARTRISEFSQRELEVREKEQQARAALDAANAEITRRTLSDRELRESARPMKIALETAASEIAELQEEIKRLRRNERDLQTAIEAAETRNATLTAVIDSLEKEKLQPAHQGRAEAGSIVIPVVNPGQEVTENLAGIKAALESMHKMAGKSPLARRLKESINSIESLLQKIHTPA